MHLDDPDMQAFLEVQLEPGERVLWTGRPGRGAAWRHASDHRGLRLALLYELCFVLVASLAPGPMLFSLVILIVAGIAGAYLAAQNQAARWYVLTNRRALSLSLGQHPFFLACQLDADCARRITRSDGPADLIFEGTVLADGEPGDALTFYDISDPWEVERLVAGPRDPEQVPGPPPERTGPVALDRFAGWLRSGHEGRRGAAVVALSRIGRPAVPTLLDALTDGQPRVRASAAEALSRIAASQSLPQDAIDALVRATVDVAAFVRSAARDALRECGKAAVPALVCRPPRDGFWGWRNGAVAALDIVGDEAFSAAALDGLVAGDAAFAEGLQEEFTNGGELPRRVVAAWSAHGPAGAEALLRAVARGPEWAALAAAEALTATVAEVTRARIAGLSPATAAAVAHVEAAHARIEEIKRQAAVAVERGRLAALESQGRAVIAPAEGDATSQAVREQLLAILDAGERSARLAAAVGLGFMGNARGMHILLPALQYDRRWVRYAAARSVGHLGAAAADALPVLEGRRRREEDGATRRALGVAIRQIRYAAQMVPTELMAASAPAGRGTELEPTTAPLGRGTELMPDEGVPESKAGQAPPRREGTRG